MEDDLNGRQPKWKMTYIIDNEENLLSNICKSTLLELKIILKIWKRRKTTSMEDDLNGRGPQWKTTSMKDDLNERQPQ